MSVYIYIWLLVGGTGSFSMKTAPLLWLLVGFVRVNEFGRNASPEPEPAAPVRRIGRSIATA